MSATRTNLVLVVDDDAAFREEICRGLNELVITAKTPETGLKLAKRYQPSVVISEVKFRRRGRRNVSALVRGYKAASPGVEIVIATENGTVAEGNRAVAAGCCGYFEKASDKLADVIIAAGILALERFHEVTDQVTEEVADG